MEKHKKGKKRERKTNGSSPGEPRISKAERAKWPEGEERKCEREQVVQYQNCRNLQLRSEKAKNKKRLRSIEHMKRKLINNTRNSSSF